MKSAGFHGLPLNAVFFSFVRSNTDINVMYKSLAWNLVDSTTECCIFHQNQYRYTWMSKSLPWNLLDFMKSARFHTDLHYYMLNMQCISLPMKSGGFHHEIRQISWSTTKMLYFSSEPKQIYKSLPWNLPDCMKSARFHLSMKSAGFHVFAKWAKDQWSYFLDNVNICENNSLLL